MLEAFDAKGLDAEALVAGSGYDAAFLRNPFNRVDWATFAALSDRAAELCEGRVTLAELGAQMCTVPGYAFVRALTGYMLSARQLYRAVQRWIGPEQFPNISAELLERDDGALVLTMQLSPEDRPSRAFFEISAGALGHLPTMLGQAPSTVSLAVSGRRAELTIVPPSVPGLRARVAGLIRTMRGTPAAVRELGKQQAALKESYEALLRVRQDFRQVIETMSDAVMIQRADVVLWANKALLDVLGYQRAEEISGRRVLDFVHPDDAEMVRTRLAGPIDSKATPIDCRLHSRDGAVTTLEIAPTQEIVFEGAPARFVVGRDRTERKRFQEQLMLADRMATVGVLAAGVAHEINNPLTYVGANIELARDAASLLGNDGTSIVESLDAAIDGVDRVTAIVRDLKMLSRADTPGSDPDEATAIDARAVVDSTLSLARKQVERKARLVFAPGPPLGVRARRSRLGQVLLNLLLNAAEAIPEGNPDRNEVRVALEARGDDVVISVRDTGPGISEENLARIFDPFFTTKPPGEGTGLGLSICQRIVTDLGGTITASSRPGEGACFLVSVPAASLEGAPISESRRSAISGTSVRRRARLLVVDDEPLLRNVLRAVLEESHDVALASTGAEAIELLLDGHQEFDLVLCDLMMADVSGMDVYEALRIKKPGLEKRLLFMTGGAFTPRGRQFLASVPNRCLEKPFDAAEVFAAVDDQLARHERERDVG